MQTGAPLAVCGLPQSSLLQKGVRCETRQLPLGDMLWIAKRPDDPTSEVLLGYIVERKTASDLASSIIDGRYAYVMEGRPLFVLALHLPFRFICLGGG